MSADRPAAVTVFYDSDCGFCKVCVGVLLRWDRGGRVYPASIQGPEGDSLLGPLAPSERLSSAHLVTADGVLLSGGEAAPALFRQLPAGRPLASLSAALMPVTKLVYRLLTRLRSVIGPALPERWRRGAEALIEARRQGTIPPTDAR
jgi:predicted DCC family thiol-disulfide oxidoreductase YuxK